MAFIVPAFPLAVNVWHGGGAFTYLAPDVATMGNLTPGRRSMLAVTPTSTSIQVIEMELLLPKLTDVRCNYNLVGSTDTIEVPAGSNRFYRVGAVDDIGKGFANEHRIVWMNYLLQGSTFSDVGAIPAPVPLP